MRVGVVGVGAMGTLHVRGYSGLDDCELVGLYDIDLERAREVAGRYQVHCFSELDALLSRVDAVTVAVPTPDHHLVGFAAWKLAVTSWSRSRSPCRSIRQIA